MIKVRSIMTKEVIIIPKNASIKDAAKLMESKSVTSLPVVVDKNKPIAIIAEKDIIKGIISKKKSVEDIMSRDFMIISPLTKFSEMTKVLREKNIKRFIVSEDEKLVGLVTETDIIQAMRDFTRLQQIIQEIILAIFGLTTAFFLFYFSPLGASIFG